MDRIFTWPNLISVSRMILIIPIGYCLMSDFPNHRLWAAGFIAIAVITDLLDGFLARKWHQVTDFGKIIDPLADKVSISVYAVLLVIKGDIPLWYVILVILRDIITLLGGLYILRKKKVVTQSNWLGKIYVSLVALVFFLATIQIEKIIIIQNIAIACSIIMLIWSSTIYMKRLFIGRTVIIDKE